MKIDLINEFYFLFVKGFIVWYYYKNVCFVVMMKCVGC